MGNTALATPSDNGGEIMEAVIAKGDLAKLTPEERSRYYIETCRSVGLNPLTRPYDYIVLNQKLTLYANKGAADQLRAIGGISLRILSQEKVGDLYVVTVEASDDRGRVDTDVGIVALAGLQGEKLANGIMKAITKAKRRVTFSMCGLNMLDETEVETIPGAKRVQVDIESGEIGDAVDAVTIADTDIDLFFELIDGATTRAEMQRIGGEIKAHGIGDTALRKHYRARWNALEVEPREEAPPPANSEPVEVSATDEGHEAAMTMVLGAVEGEPGMDRWT